MLSIDLSAINRLSSDLQRKGAAIEPAAEKALDRVAQVALQAKARQVGKTYARAIPRGKNGKPKWKRSGDFQRGQTVSSGRLSRTIETQGEAAKYEGRLADLPRGRDGVDRRNAAADEAFKVIEPQIQRVFDAEMNTALRD